MADPTLSNHLLILLGDGGDPESFGFPCGAKARSVKYKNNTGEEVLLDCDDPLNTTAAIIRWTQSQDTEISISGRLSTEAVAMWREWVDSGKAKNIRVAAFNTAELNGGYHTLPAILQEVEWGSEGSDTVTLSATIVGAGRRIWTAAT